MTTNFLNERQGGYSVESGVFGAVNEKIVTSLNDMGQYVSDIDATRLTQEELDALARVSAMSNVELNEQRVADSLFGSVQGIKSDKLLGYYSELYAGYVATGSFRSEASSGGLSTWLLSELLRRGLVDGVIHAVRSPSGAPELFRYAVSRNEVEVRAGAKSRYYPLDLSNVLRMVKKHGGRYAVTGIPSFVMELRLLAEYDEAFKRSIVFCLGLICGHQKSAKYVEAIGWQHGIDPGDLTDADFRKKVPGVRGDEYVTELTGTIAGDKLSISRRSPEVFVGSWSHGFFKAKFSDYTDDLFNETADVSLGDAWLPQYVADSAGTSLLIVRNPIIGSILSEGIQSGDLHLEPLSPDQVISSQAGLVRHAHDELPYRLARMDLRNEWRPTKRVSASYDLPPLRRKIQDIRERISEESHIHYRDAVDTGEWTHFYEKMKPLVDRHNSLYALTDARRIMRKGPSAFFKRALREVRRLSSRS